MLVRIYKDWKTLNVMGKIEYRFDTILEHKTEIKEDRLSDNLFIYFGNSLIQCDCGRKHISRSGNMGRG